MFYKIKNLLLLMLFCAATSAATRAEAQGVVSLSEEAMFDDGLESGEELPDPNRPRKIQAPADKGPADTQAAPAGPVNVPLTLPGKGPQQPQAKGPLQIQPKGPAAAQVPDEPKAVPSAPQAPKISAAAELPTEKKIDLFGDSEDTGSVDGDLFSQMSELEKRTALLNLELRREKLQNEIEAVKNQRRQALQQEKDKIEQQKLKNLEFEKAQEQKVLQEQQKLRDLDIQFETLRQEKLLNSYKNYMLEENQKWIANNASFYKQIADLRGSNKKLTEETKTKLQAIQTEALKAQRAYIEKSESYKKEIRDLQAQIGILRNRISTMEKEQDELRQNPFANGVAPVVPEVPAEDEIKGSEGIEEEPVETDLSKLYAVTEIRGQGGELIAKLINKNGTAFYVKKGTTLQSGHIVGDITSTYVTAEKDGEKKYLYFAAGGIVPVETSGFEVDSSASKTAPKKQTGPIAGTL